MRLREVGDPEDETLVRETTKAARPFRSPTELSPLVKKISGSRVVMLGESSHGTHEYYDIRRALSEELIQNHGFNFIAVEGDWPPAWQLNNFLHGEGENPRTVLGNFSRWPTWMWANQEIISLAESLRAININRLAKAKAGFYGLDVYSLFESIDAVLTEVAKVSPFLARRLTTRYECFDPFSRDEISYAKSLLQLPAGCHEAVMKNLEDLLKERLKEKSLALTPFGDPLFDAEQNARTVANAESYYRAMVSGSDDSWNIRDRHMLETLEVLLDRYGPGAKAIVWAHNTHIGDYRATDMLEQGQINIGGLAREKWGEENIALVGFGTYRGEVIASQAWDGLTEKMEVPRAAAGSYESAFHKAAKSAGPNFWIDLSEESARKGVFSETRGHRAIGVVYHPAYERLGNYVPTSLANRYDHFLFLNETTALLPLRQPFSRHELPETYPQGM